MQCDEVKALISKGYVNNTRGERASVMAHTDHCKECYDALFTLPQPCSNPETVMRILAEDQNDPEYIEIVRKSKKRMGAA